MIASLPTDQTAEWRVTISAWFYQEGHHMFVVAEHKISDPAGFANAVKSATPNIPADLKLHQVLPNADGSSAVCVWEADSVQKVRQVVEAALGRFSSNTFYEVAANGAVGLPGSSR